MQATRYGELSLLRGARNSVDSQLLARRQLTARRNRGPRACAFFGLVCVNVSLVRLQKIRKTEIIKIEIWGGRM